LFRDGSAAAAVLSLDADNPKHGYLPGPTV
jgi:hypothetical protein